MGILDCQSPWLQTILQRDSNQNIMVLAQKQTLDQWNRTESPETNLCTYAHLIYNTEGKNIQWRQDSLSNKVVLWKADSYM